MKNFKYILILSWGLIAFGLNTNCSSKKYTDGKSDSIYWMKFASDSLLSMSIFDLPSDFKIEEQIDSIRMRELWKSIPEKWDCSNAFVFTVREGNNRIPKIGKLLQTEVARDTSSHWLRIVRLPGAKSEKYTLFEVVPVEAYGGANDLMGVSKMGGKVGFFDDESRLFILYFRSVGNKNKVKEWEEILKN